MSPAKRSAEDTSRLRSALLEHARQIVSREGASALTMRALASQAQCAIGLPYKVFASREDLIAHLLKAELDRLLHGFSDFVARAGKDSVGVNLGRYAEMLLNSPTIALGAEIVDDAPASEAVRVKAEETRFGYALQAAVARYLAAEKGLGRIRQDVDEDAFGFLIAGAVHNLLVSPPGYPHPTLDQLKTLLDKVANSITA